MFSNSFYQTLRNRTLDALSFANLSLPEKSQGHKEPQKWFLHKLFEQHNRLASYFANLPFQERKALILTVDRIEAGEKNIPGLEKVDTARFLIPTQLMSPTLSAIESVTTSSIMPLLRTLGVQNTLRLLSGLLSECRILLISHSPTRLAQCARSALSILAQGLLNWQHLYIPVLPPHLFQYVAAPVPYLIGILTSLAPRLDQAQQETLGEMIIINLDQGTMETRGINPHEVEKKIPDLFLTVAEQGITQAAVSPTEMLGEDLLDLMKADKKTLNGDSALINVGEKAGKAAKAVKSGFMKLKSKGKKFGKKLLEKAAGSDDEIEDENDASSDVHSANEVRPTVDNTLLPDVIYTQGAQNEEAEEEARIAFTCFFLSMFGNMRWYLSASPGKLPELDTNRFLQQKRMLGEGERTAMWPLLMNFCQSQMFVQFAKARVEEVRTRVPVTAASPLFSQCANYHRLHNIDFSSFNIRRVTRQVAQNNPSRPILQTSARKMAMLLTSNKTFEGDYNKAVSQLVEQSRESSSVLFDVMSVIWIRLRDCKGSQWKHGHQALQILRNLLYHGPMAVIAEATDGLDKIRAMKFYNDNMRSQICTQIRKAAAEVYNLLVDRAKLFYVRRTCINKRREMSKSDRGRYMRDMRIRVHMPFAQMHTAFNPKNRGQVQNAPRAAAEQNLVGMPAAPQAQNTQLNSYAQDLVGLFDAVSVSQPEAATTSGTPDPFSPKPAASTVAAPDPFSPKPSQQQLTPPRQQPVQYPGSTGMSPPPPQNKPAQSPGPNLVVPPPQQNMQPPAQTQVYGVPPGGQQYRHPVQQTAPTIRPQQFQQPVPQNFVPAPPMQAPPPQNGYPQGGRYPPQQQQGYPPQNQNRQMPPPYAQQQGAPSGYGAPPFPSPQQQAQQYQQYPQGNRPPAKQPNPFDPFG